MATNSSQTPTDLRFVDLVPPPLGLPQRSAGLATSNAALPAPFVVLSAFRPALGPGGKRKERRTAMKGWLVVVNPPFRWGKPSGDERTSSDKISRHANQVIDPDLLQPG
jgi:hypothetical protein